MQQQYEEHYHKVESIHWWFLGRRQIVRDLVVRAHRDRGGRILEIGSSAGILMRQLHQEGYRQVTGIDISQTAVDLCREAGLETQVMDAQRLTFSDAAFDVITASDVLEHLPEHQTALVEWHRVLKPGGTLIVFVPAFMFLWTAHDVANKHCRRYRRRQLQELLCSTGFEVERMSYWNTLLFPPVACIRILKRFVAGGKLPANAGAGDMFVPSEPVNRILSWLLRLENRLLLSGVNWPCGVSVMAIARKPGGR